MTGEGALELTWLDVGLASLLVAVAGGISLALRLGLGKDIVVATVRSVVQLSLVGLVLSWVFSLEHALAVVAILAVMAIAAGRASVRRADRTFPGAQWQGILTLFLCGLVTTAVGVAGLLQVQPPTSPQYVIPLFGMLLGNSLTGISLTLDALLKNLDEGAEEVEVLLALGATAREASAGVVRDAVRRGMIPIFNTMTVVGLVSLPGMMTGQILQGADPTQAVRYQLLILFMICACTAAGCAAVALLAVRSLFDTEQRLRKERIQKWKR